MLYLVIYLGIGLIHMVIGYVILSWAGKAEGKVMNWEGFALIVSMKLLAWPLDLAAMIWAGQYIIRAAIEDDDKKLENYSKEVDWIYED